jgi:hypothetical protein
MKLDLDPIPVAMINFEEKKVLVWTDQAGSTKGKRVVVSDELRARMVKPKSLKPRVWKRNGQRKP